MYDGYGALMGYDLSNAFAIVLFDSRVHKCIFINSLADT